MPALRIQPVLHCPVELACTLFLLHVLPSLHTPLGSHSFPKVTPVKHLTRIHATEIKWEYKFIRRAVNHIQMEYKALCEGVTNATKSWKDKNTYRKDCFF